MCDTSNKPTNDKTSAGTPLTDDQRDDLTDQDKQREYQQAYLEQMRRLSCPGCGDDGFV